ncbi:MAG TPA: hypothetical protein VFS02_01170 [Telluria sp.]|nr:hypothetical protein [Telluria sp.]
MLLVLAVLVPAQVTAAGQVRLTRFERDVAAVSALARQRLGPFELDTQCTYCSREFLGICAEHATESLRRMIDFGASREQIDATLAQALRDAAALADRYAPAQAWIDGLPSFSARFDSAADVVHGIGQAIRQGVGPNERQQRDATQALLALTGELGRSAMQLESGVRALNVAIDQASGYRSAIRAAIDGSEQAGRSAWHELDRASRQRRCRDSPAASFNAIRDDFSRAAQEVAGAFDLLDADTRASERALAALLAAVTDARTEVETVLRLLAAAGSDQLGAFLDRLDLAAAKRQCSELAQAAALQGFLQSQTSDPRSNTIRH